jgi:phosphoribosylanthranilate isomerase
MTQIKICGITNKRDALLAASLGVDMLGFVFYKKSKRYVEPKAARDIINELPERIGRVGVFVDDDKERVADIARASSLDTLQFHGKEPPAYCAPFRPDFKVIKAFSLKARADLAGINDYGVDFFLLDTYADDSPGGTGKAFDRKILKDFEFLRPVILSGGLTPANVSAAIRQVAPYGVDVSTGVEAAPGEKDADLIRKFVANVRKAG